MRLNEAVITHHRASRIPTYKLKKQVAINEGYLKEKPDWYEIDGKLQYFKIRNDFRLFTEQFFSMFGREILGLDTLDYRVAYVRTKDPVLKSTEEVTKCGLLSESFQDKSQNYYLISELMNAQNSDLVHFGGYTLETLLRFFKQYLAEEDYNIMELYLITQFIGDGFTHQEDRNPHNISVHIPKIEGISYTERLHPSVLAKKGKFEHLVSNSFEQYQLKGMRPTKSYDNERILGVDHKNVFTYKSGTVWAPLLSYDEDTKFNSIEQAEAMSQEFYDGYDPNLLSLYMEYPKICKPIFERLAYDDEYRRILERFDGKTTQIALAHDEMEYVTNVLKDKQKVFERILHY